MRGKRLNEFLFIICVYFFMNSILHSQEFEPIGLDTLDVQYIFARGDTIWVGAIYRFSDGSYTCKKWNLLYI